MQNIIRINWLSLGNFICFIYMRLQSVKSMTGLGLRTVRGGGEGVHLRFNSPGRCQTSHCRPRCRLLRFFISTLIFVFSNKYDLVTACLIHLCRRVGPGSPGFIHTQIRVNYTAGRPAWQGLIIDIWPTNLGTQKNLRFQQHRFNVKWVQLKIAALTLLTASRNDDANFLIAIDIL